MINGIIKNKLLFSLLLTGIYLIISLLTLKDYGVSWDSAAHYFRGQAYLHYFLTGRLNYDDLPKINLQGTNGDPKNIPSPRRSIYQPLDFPFASYYLRSDSGHPPLNDILAATFNYILFQKLGWLGDVYSHNMFIVFSSSLTVFVVIYFMIQTFGIFPSMISYLSLLTYPLFWSESHFNIKDPVQTSFFSLAIWAFYKSLKELNFKWQLLFILSFSFGMAVKFNILFLPFILLLYIIYLVITKRYPASFINKVKVKKYLLWILIWPLISLAILFLIWPYLRQNIPTNFLSILKYYKIVGTESGLTDAKYIFLGFNTYPFLCFIYSTPPFTLFLFLVGIISPVFYSKKNFGVAILWALWFLVPFMRVSIPGASIYGGLRQIFEFIPALALLSGLGAYYLVDKVKLLIHKLFLISLRPKLIKILTIFLFMFPIASIIRLYPNENVYFNYLIGGLVGAKQRNFPYWGNTFGNVYKQGIDWINNNAENNSRLVLIQGNSTNAPIENIRKDISFSFRNFSGIEKRGEYIMELTFNNPVRVYHYVWEYVENFLVPTYVIKKEGVPILTIWKNDIKNYKDEFKLKEYSKKFKISTSRNKVISLNLNDDYLLSRFFLKCLDGNINTDKVNGYIETSLDGVNWFREKDALNQRQNFGNSNVQKDEILFYFAGRRAKYIKVILNGDQFCVFNKYADVYYFQR
jgi:hypothetical protein